MKFILDNWMLISVAMASGFMLFLPVMQGAATAGLSAQQAVQMINREKALVIDVCSAEEYAAGHLIGASVWYDPNGEGNSVQDLQQGRFWIDYDYTPVPPLEQLGLRQRITSRYLVDFAQLATGNTGAA